MITVRWLRLQASHLYIPSCEESRRFQRLHLTGECLLESRFDGKDVLNNKNIFRDTRILQYLYLSKKQGHLRMKRFLFNSYLLLFLRF